MRTVKTDAKQREDSAMGLFSKVTFLRRGVYRKGLCPGIKLAEI